MTESETTQEIAANYERDGFVVVPNLLSREECQTLKAEGVRVLQDKSQKSQSVFVGVAAASETYYKLASHPSIAGVLQKLMPDGVMFLSDKFVFKSGVQTFGTPWHCDIAYWKNTRPKISVWIPLDDVTPENGALKVLPGGHKTQWAHGGNEGVGAGSEFDQTIRELNENPEGEIVCAMNAGDALVFSDCLPHASTPNTNGADRYAIISTYHAPAPDDFFDVNFPARHVIAPLAD